MGLKRICQLTIGALADAVVEEAVNCIVQLERQQQGQTQVAASRQRTGHSNGGANAIAMEKRRDDDARVRANIGKRGQDVHLQRQAKMAASRNEISKEEI